MSSSHEKLWEKCLEFIRDNISPEQYNAWFQPLTSVGFKDGALNISVPSSYFAEQLEERYLNLIKAAIKKVYPAGTQLFYHYNIIGDDPATNVSMAPSNSSAAVKPVPGAMSNPFSVKQVEEIDPQLNPHYTFENYCGSQCNQVAKSIGEAIAANPKMKTFNPLFIFGPTGVGKTHLIQAIGIRIKERTPSARVLYVTARLFESQFTTAANSGKLNDFVNFYQSIDTLIIDDIQDFIGKPRTQNTFFHIFNHLHQNQRQLIMSSDCCPSQMEGMESRLLSRFKWGMTAELERPDLELRREVLRQRASQDGLEIADEVLDYIAENVTDSVRELEGIIVSLVAHATVLNREITLDLARNVVSNAVKINRRQVNFEMITQQVSAHYDVDPDLIFSKTRKREVSDARQMVMYMAKRLAKMPLKMIGTRLSRSHATVLYACRNIEERLPLEKQLQNDVKTIERMLMGPAKK